MSGCGRFAVAIRDAVRRGVRPVVEVHQPGSIPIVTFQLHDHYPGSGIGAYDLFDWDGITTPGWIWQSCSKQKLHDLIEAKTGVRPSQPEKRPQRAKAKARSRSPRRVHSP